MPFVNFPRTGNPFRETLYFDEAGHFEVFCQVPGVSPACAETTRCDLEQVALFPQLRCYSVSPLAVFILYKLYKVWSLGGYGEYRVTSSRRNNCVEVLITGGETHCYRIDLDELKEIEQVFNHMELYLTYKKIQNFDGLC